MIAVIRTMNPIRALLAIMLSHIDLQKEQLSAYWLDHIGYFGPP
jgi:hypothetical protein